MFSLRKRKRRKRLRHGACYPRFVLVSSQEGESPYTLALRSGNEECVEYVKSLAGGDIIDVNDGDDRKKTEMFGIPIGM